MPLAKHGVTNPPHGCGLACAFVNHALRLTAATGGKVAMLLNVTGLGHPLCHRFWTTNPPAVSMPWMGATAGPTETAPKQPPPSADSATAGWCGSAAAPARRNYPGRPRNGPLTGLLWVSCGISAVAALFAK